MLEQPKKLVTWTRAYFWATVIMALAAGFAAYFTARYVNYTRRLFEQTQETNQIAHESLQKSREDSQLEYRPYVLVDVDTIRGDRYLYKERYDVYEITVVARYINQGKTPAIQFRCGVEIGFSKEALGYIDLDGPIEESEVNTVLFGRIEKPTEKVFQLKVPRNPQIGDTIALALRRGIELMCQIRNIEEFPIYYIFEYSYSDLNNRYYKEKCGICLLVNFKSGAYHFTWDSYTIIQQ